MVMRPSKHHAGTVYDTPFGPISVTTRKPSNIGFIIMAVIIGICLGGLCFMGSISLRPAGAGEQQHGAKTLRGHANTNASLRERHASGQKLRNPLVARIPVGQKEAEKGAETAAGN